MVIYITLFLLIISPNTLLYPLKNKSDVSIIFPQFKVIVKKFFNLPILVLYSNNGGEYIKLEIFYLPMAYHITPPHHIHMNSMLQLNENMDI